MVEYAMDNINNQLFVSKYQLFLPNKKDLEKELQKLLEDNELTKNQITVLKKQ
jgi:hypothetical protein